MAIAASGDIGRKMPTASPFADAEPAERVGQAIDLARQLGVGQRAQLARRPLPDRPRAWPRALGVRWRSTQLSVKFIRPPGNQRGHAMPLESVEHALVGRRPPPRRGRATTASQYQSRSATERALELRQRVDPVPRHEPRDAGLRGGGRIGPPDDVGQAHDWALLGGVGIAAGQRFWSEILVDSSRSRWRVAGLSASVRLPGSDCARCSASSSFPVSPPVLFTRSANTWPARL